MTHPTPNPQARELVSDYLRRTSMAPADFARRIGYGYSTVNMFLNGRYRKNTGSSEAQIATAALNYLEQNPAPEPDEFAGQLYEIGNVKTMRTAFDRLFRESCIQMVYAPPGSGKTDVARALIREYRAAGHRIFRVYCRYGITKRDLVRRIAAACGSVADLSIDRTLNNLRYDFPDQHVAIYLDEAQHLDVACLETVRELKDEMHWSLCFAGSHQLDRVFNKWAGELEQLERRVIDRVYLPAPTAEEVANIVRSEIPSLGKAQIQTLIASSTVDIRSGKSSSRYISIGRVMDSIRQLQQVLAEAESEKEQKVEAIA
jgi:DNA transposition AAA+ family ATPase